MKYFPVFTDLRGRLCLVIGEGKLADEKERLLKTAGARVLRISHFNEEHGLRAYLIVADVDKEQAAKIRAFGDRHRIFVNIVDKTAHCSFIVPAIVERGDLLVAISTSGASPGLSSWFRRRLQGEIREGIAELVAALGDTRAEVKRRMGPYALRKDFYQQLFSNGFLDLDTDRDRARSVILEAAEDYLQSAGRLKE